jgi:hypothetical protein
MASKRATSSSGSGKDIMAARMKAVSQHRKVKVFCIDAYVYKVCDEANGDNSVDDCEESAQTHDLQTNYAGVSVSATKNPMFRAIFVLS